jgi:S-adenosylmethionine uptake transporter
MSAPETAPSAEMTEDHAYRKNIIISILLTCVAYGYYNIGDATLKILGAKFHFSQIIVFNCLISGILISLAGWWREGRGAFVMIKPRWFFLRGGLSSVVSILNTYAIPHVQLTTFYTLIFTSPLWVALLAALFLKEKLEPKRLAVIMVGFAVILFIFRPGGGMFNIWSLFVLASSFFYSCTLVVMRHLGPKESRTMLIVVGSLMGVLAGLPFLPGHYIAPSAYEWELFGLLALLGTIGIFCIAYAFQNAPSAAAVAPFHYTQIVWGALLGYFLFDEVPGTSIIIGACVIIMAGLYVILSETRRRRQPPTRGIA